MTTFKRRGPPTGLLVVALLPVLILLAPAVLAWLALSERLARCPACGRRGSLHDMTPLVEHSTEGWRLRRSRLLRTRELACQRCGAHFRQPPGEPLQRVEGVTA